MKAWGSALAGAVMALSASQAAAQDLIDQGFVHGWNLLVDPSFGNGCLIQTVYEDLSVVRIGYDALNDQGYFAVYNKAWGDVKKGEQYNIRFDLDGQSFDAVATGIKTGSVPGGIVFFKDRNFIHAIAQKKGMTLFGQNGQQVMAIDLSGTSKALEYTRKCQEKYGWGG